MTNEKYALLDTDFISKLHITRKDDNNRMIDRVLELPGFCFVCHAQIQIELGRHNTTATSWLQENISAGQIKAYTDDELLTELAESFGILGITKYRDILKDSCAVFSNGFYQEYYSALDTLIETEKSIVTESKFVNILRECDKNVGIDNNLGEIKIYVMAQIMQALSMEGLYVFCSDDRKARYGIATQTPMNCVSALGAFCLVRKHLSMKKEEAICYFSSWMRFHEKKQTEFKIYSNTAGKQLIKMNGYQIFDGIYDETIGLWKDGYLKIK